MSTNIIHSTFQSTGTCKQHAAGHVEQVFLIPPWVWVFCLCSHCPSVIFLCVKSNLETSSQPVITCTPSPFAIFISFMGRTKCVCRACRIMLLCYTWKLFIANGTDLLLPPNLTSRSHFVIPCLGFLVSKSRDSTSTQASVRAALERLALRNPWS